LIVLHGQPHLPASLTVAGCRWLQRDGKSMEEEVSILLGHTSVKITAERYAFLRSEDVAESLSGRTIPVTGTAV
jgi:hypothetical protein